MNKNTIRLTESQLHSMIKECVKSILSEGSKIQNRVPYPLADEYHFDDNNNLQFKPKDPYADEYTSLEAKNKRNIRHQQRYNKNNMRLWFDFTLNDQSLQANLDYLRQGDDFWLKEGEGLGVLQWEYFDPTKSNAKRISVNNLVELWNIDGMYFFLVRKDKEKEFEN